jgi:hypothetical protein
MLILQVIFCAKNGKRSMQKSNDDKIKIWNQENIERNSREYRKKSS